MTMMPHDYYAFLCLFRPRVSLPPKGREDRIATGTFLGESETKALQHVIWFVF